MEAILRLLTERPIERVRNQLRDMVTMGVAAGFVLAGALAALAALGVQLSHMIGPVWALLSVAGLSLVIGLGLVAYVRARAETERRIAEAEARSRQTMLLSALASTPGVGAGGAILAALILGFLNGRTGGDDKPD
jgi:formate/nitrite transporter FocA (FNT family)